MEKIKRYNKLIPFIVIFKEFDFKVFLMKILEIKPWNSIQEISEINIKEIINMYE